jgi:antibiotic biosynthesis monooxygenase (ABM) superfamily enzyme
LEDSKLAISSNYSYYRIIALWVFCEGFVGGIIHGLKLPISGIVVGSCAVICISLLAQYKYTKGAIIKATIIVAIFKMMLSPQAPPMAYVAVFFQGILGELLFSNRQYFKYTSILFAIIALLESGLQRIFIVTVIYGKNLWIIIDETVSNLFHLQTIAAFSNTFIALYLLLHVIAAIIVTFIITTVTKKMPIWKNEQSNYLINDTAITTNYLLLLQPAAKKKNIIIWLFIYVGLLILYLNAIGLIAQPLVQKNVVLNIFLRSSIILLSWYLIVGPITSNLLKKWLINQKTKWQKDITEVLLLLPKIKAIAYKSWQLSNEEKGLKRICLCSKIILINTLQNDGTA